MRGEPYLFCGAGGVRCWGCSHWSHFTEVINVGGAKLNLLVARGRACLQFAAFPGVAARAGRGLLLNGLIVRLEQHALHFSELVAAGLVASRGALGRRQGYSCASALNEYLESSQSQLKYLRAVCGSPRRLLRRVALGASPGARRLSQGGAGGRRLQI